ncbi:hypothetical protein PG988_004563 [Apiospora saccharicola]
MEFDPLGLLEDECSSADQYPEYSEDRLFKKFDSDIVFWEKRPKDEFFYKKHICTYQDLDNYLNFIQPDPDFRFVFLEPKNSRSELNCTRKMFQRVFAFHEVHPSFLDYVHSFGDQEEPLDAGLCHFQSDDVTTAEYSEDSSAVRNIFMGLGRAIPTLGRSGNALRHSYLLRAVERVDDHPDWPWSIRHAAVYHSFDTDTGRSLWINIKGNDCLRKTIWNDTLHGKTLWNKKIDLAFQTNLTLHLKYIQWCGANWRWFVRDTESAIRPYMADALTAPVEKKPYFKSTPTESWRVEIDEPDSPSKRSTGSNFRDSYPYLVAVVRKIRGLPTNQNWDMDPEKNRLDRGIDLKTRHKRAVLDLAGLYSFHDLQNLTMIGERIEEGLLVIKLNVKALHSIRGYYDDLQKQESFPLPRRGIPIFLSKVEGTINSLEVQQMQLESLCSKLAQCRKLFEDILQYRALQVSQVFAEKAHESTKSMESIAFRTANETSSMHVITVVALIFLPGTFVTSFFQSGVLNWDGDAGPDTWTLRSSALRLFFAVPRSTMEEQRHSFRTYVKRKSHQGHSSSVKKQPYICPQDLYDYWDHTKIAGLYNKIPADDIYDNYLRIFSILVWIGAEQIIDNFIDRRSDVRDNMLPMSDDAYEAYRLELPIQHRVEFLRHQWRFAPLVFGKVRRRQELDRQHIIPVQSRNPISAIGDYESTIFKIKLHPKCGEHCCNSLGQDNVIFKQMEDHDMWKREVDAYIAINNPKPAEFVTGFYGSFCQGNSGTIVLEYATGGTLEDLLKTTLTLEGTGQREFWEKMFDLTLALNCIHHNEYTNLLGIHQDIKPDNILVFKDTASTIPVCFKIADFGRCHFRPISEARGNRGGTYTGASMMYTTPEMDIWALGAVFSETLVWSIRGEDGRDAYTRMRKEAVGKRMTDAGYDGCFHDSENRLHLVDRQHHEVLTEANQDGGTFIGQQVSDIILGKMLQPLSRRGDAQAIYNHWSTRETPDSIANTRSIVTGSDYRDSESGQDTPTSMQVLDVSRLAPSSLRIMNPAEPPPDKAGASETIESLWAQLKDKKHRSPRLLGASAQFAPGYDWMKENIKGHRDPAQYVSDACTKTQWSSSASASSLTNTKKSKDLEKAVSRLQFTMDEDHVETRWGGTVQDGIADLREGKAKVVLFYLLTSAAWNPRLIPMHRALIDLARCDDMDLSPPAASVQIIQYGEHPRAATNIFRIQEAVRRGLGAHEPL